MCWLLLVGVCPPFRLMLRWSTEIEFLMSTIDHSNVMIIIWVFFDLLPRFHCYFVCFDGTTLCSPVRSRTNQSCCVRMEFRRRAKTKDCAGTYPKHARAFSNGPFSFSILTYIMSMVLDSYGRRSQPAN